MRVKNKSPGWRSHADFRATFVSRKYDIVEPPLTATFLKPPPLYNGHFSLSPRWPLQFWRGLTVILSCVFSIERYWRHVVNLVLRHVLAIAFPPTLFNFLPHVYTFHLFPYSWIHQESGILIKDYESKQRHQDLALYSFSYARYPRVKFTPIFKAFNGDAMLVPRGT